MRGVGLGLCLTLLGFHAASAEEAFFGCENLFFSYSRSTNSISPNGSNYFGTFGFMVEKLLIHADPTRGYLEVTDSKHLKDSHRLTEDFTDCSPQFDQTFGHAKCLMRYVREDEYKWRWGTEVREKKWVMVNFVFDPKSARLTYTWYDDSEKSLSSACTRIPADKVMKFIVR